MSWRRSGPVPESTRGRRAWRQAAAQIEHYRRTYQITDPDRALGPEPHDPAQRADRQRVRTAIERVQAKQRATDRTRDVQPTGERTNQQRPQRAAWSARPRAGRRLAPQKGAPRWPALDPGPSTTRTGPAGRCGRSARPTCRPSSPTSATTPTSCWPAPAPIGRWWRCGCGPAWAGQAAPPRRRWRRLRAAEWAAWTRTLPWRVAAILGIGAGGGVLGSLLAPRLGLVLGALAAVAAGWGLRFRPSPDAVAWRRGAAGERRTARLLGPLERHGWAVLHDLAVPGSRANIDHLVIGPGGVFVIDSKQYRGRLQLDPSGRLWHGRYPLAPTLRAVSFEADQAARVLTDPDVVVVPIVAVHGAQVPWGKVVMQGVPVVAARRLPSMLRALPAVLGPERVAGLADQARVRFHAAA